MAFIPRKGMTPERRERSADALELKKKGHTYREIGKQLGVSATQARDDVQDALQEITREPAEEVLKMELERLDAAYLRLSTDMERIIEKVAPNDDEVDLNSVEQVRKLVATQLTVSERRARLLGLEAIKAEINGDLLRAVSNAFATLEATPDEDLKDDASDEDMPDEV